MHEGAFEPYDDFREYPVEEMIARARAFHDDLRRRRSVRMFSDRPVPEAVLEACLRTAGTAPSGANMQPWHFVVVTDPRIKRRIREAAEAEERAFYQERASAEWLEALAPLGTDEHKPHLETAPVLIPVFAERYGLDEHGRRRKHYYVMESVGLATGFLLCALHHAGLATLVHTPSPMGFLAEICGRPEREKPFVLLVTGYPAEDCRTPAEARRKKPLPAFTTWL